MNLHFGFFPDVKCSYQMPERAPNSEVNASPATHGMSSRSDVSARADLHS